MCFDSSCSTFPSRERTQKRSQCGRAGSRRKHRHRPNAAADPYRGCCAPRRSSRQPIFTAHSPAPALDLDMLTTRSPRPARCAKAITGPSHRKTRCSGHHTMFGSSKVACIFARSCNNRTREASSRPEAGKLQELQSSRSREHLSRCHLNTVHLRGRSRVRALTRSQLAGQDGQESSLLQIPFDTDITTE